MYRGDSGVILKVPNGTLIGYDHTGVTLRLSEQVVADLRDRLGLEPDADALRDAAYRIGDIDAWNLRIEKDWIKFDAKLPGYDYPRGFCRSLTGGDIVADSTGPVLGVFSLGGARRAEGTSRNPLYSAHVLSACDDIGAVGMAGVDPAPETELLEQQREETQDTRATKALLARRQKRAQSLPICVVRAETDESTTITELSTGEAMRNLRTAIFNLTRSAKHLDRPAKILAITIDFGAEDMVTKEAEYVSTLRKIMAEITEFVGSLHLHEPLFLLRDNALNTKANAYWQVLTFLCDFNVILPNPDYVLDRDRFGRLTPESLERAAQTDAIVLEHHQSRVPWACPVFLLAETLADQNAIRVNAQSLEPLNLSAEPSFEVGGVFGFKLLGAGDTEITAVELDADDPKSLILSTSEPITAGAGVTLEYAMENGGAICDMWLDDETGIRRWALPCRLEVQKGC
ncbi:MAG: hypothetical protein ABJO67_13095 [Pseudoruegeria sp.]